MNTESLWLKTASPAAFPRLDSDLRTDVLIVGGGIAGLTAAYLLLKARKSVVLLERERLGRGETGHTTAHVTYVTDVRLSELVKRFGRDHAQAAWEAGVSAMEQIQAIVEEEGIDCELTSVPSFLVAAAGKDLASETEQLREDVRHAEELGFDVSFVESAPLLARPAMRIANQLKFHPAKYLAGLAEKVKAMGGMIFEESEVTEFQDNPRLAKARGQTIQFDHVVIATHVPLQGLRTMVDATLLQSKLALYSTYAIGATVPKNSVPQMLWWDTADPYLYLRVESGGVHDYVILGGEDHKTGQETDTELPYRRLTESLSYLIPEALPQDRWSSRVVETVDGLPYIGSIGEGQFLGTGFAGNGMTFGTLTGMMACDAITGRRNPWSELFAVERKTLSASMDYMAENKDYPYYLVKGRLTGGEAGRAEDLKPGEGKVLRTKEGKVAAHRDDRGVLQMRSAVCPHMGCIVNWNAAEKTWDCPCHGSRFHADGKVMGGPAESSLAPRKGHE